MATGDSSIILQPGEGKALSAMGVQMTFKAVSEDTGGSFAFFEYTAPPGFGGPPPHIHRRMIEVFYILEGELTLHLGERTVKATPGTFGLVSPGTTHTFSNAGSTPARFLILVSPGGFEEYFEELPEIIARHGYPPPPEIIASLGQKYDFEPAEPPGS